MKLSELLETVANSTVDDWHKTDIHTIHGWEYGGETLEPKEFYHLAVLQEDVDISLVYAGTVRSDFVEPWTENYPDAHASSVSVQLRYRGCPVYEWVGVIVDGGRYLLPLPKRTGQDSFEVSQDQLPTARLFFGLYGSGGAHEAVEDALKRGGVEIV